MILFWEFTVPPFTKLIRFPPFSCGDVNGRKATTAESSTPAAAAAAVTAVAGTWHGLNRGCPF